MKNLTYLELYKREPKIARLLLINHYFKPHSITYLDNITTHELWVGGQHVLDKYIMSTPNSLMIKEVEDLRV